MEAKLKQVIENIRGKVLIVCGVYHCSLCGSTELQQTSMEQVERMLNDFKNETVNIKWESTERETTCLDCGADLEQRGSPKRDITTGDYIKLFAKDGAIYDLVAYVGNKEVFKAKNITEREVEEIGKKMLEKYLLIDKDYEDI